MAYRMWCLQARCVFFSCFLSLVYFLFVFYFFLPTLCPCSLLPHLISISTLPRCTPVSLVLPSLLFDDWVRASGFRRPRLGYN
jgi:hypothetical protein